jgi:hypothetical protein
MRGMKNLIWIEAGQTAKNEILKSIKEPKWKKILKKLKKN